jgi:poly(A) polymerase
MIVMRLPADALQPREETGRLLAVLNGDGEQAMVVGGAVRNALLGEPAGDIDIAATALPRQVMARARAAGFRAIPTGVEHGTVTIIVAGHPFEVTTLREDIETDGRRAKVSFGRDFARDARRRDFTMNALYADEDGVVHDFVGGLADLEARRVRFIGDAGARIREDYLRILRLFRFHAHYGEGPLDREALAAAIRERAGVARLSSERVQAELLKLLAARRAGEGVAEIAEAGFLVDILGGVPDTRAFVALADSDHAPTLRLAALAVRIVEDAERLTERLRLSNAQSERLAAIARVLPALHGRAEGLDARRVRALAWRFGAGALTDALSVTAAREAMPVDHLRRLCAIAATPLPPLPWNGATLLAAGLTEGPALGATLARAERLWISADFPTDTTEQAAILARALIDP